MRVSGENENVKTGFRAVDTEHEVQLRLLDALAVAIDLERPREEILPVLDQFVSYTNAHFLSEQLLMRLHAYPEYDRHVQEHDRLIEQAHAVQKAFESGHDPAAHDLLLYLRDWLLGHMRTMDRAFGQYLGRQGPGPAQPASA